MLPPLKWIMGVAVPLVPQSAWADGMAVVLPNVVLLACRGLLLCILVFLLVYAIRHYVFTLNRLYARQNPLYAHIEQAVWPRVAVFIAAHNEEAVVAGCIQSLLRCAYPHDRLVIMPVNDRSTDQTRAIIDGFVARHPDRLRPFHRESGPPGKAAALKDATDIVEREDLADIIIIFDADYLPSKSLVKQLVAAFFDPEVGAVMGRVVPQNAAINMLTRLLDLERAGGYQVDQQARFNLGAVAQYGGTVGGVRLSALREVGGWHPSVLAEDTDLTYRLLLSGWRTAYLGHAECYEEVPESWAVRFRQIGRWAKGHNQAMARYARRVLTGRGLSWIERLDGLALLGVFMMSPVLMLGWMLAIVVAVTGSGFDTRYAMTLGLLMATVSGMCLGNFAAFFQVAAAVQLDRHQRRIRLLPFLLTGFLVSMVAITKATLDWLILDRLLRREFRWDKTARYRKAAGGDAT
ncbi:MAG: glycosyltransferase family 2 protein [Pseudomonadota bacterium]|nr:glycosyltransferase family 2 protein [Pseudomonadota bacterium]